MQKISDFLFLVGGLLLISLATTILYGVIYFYPNNILAILGIQTAPMVLHTVPNMPWTDIAENVLGGFLISHGQVQYTDFVIPHMPGIPAFLALVLTLFNASTAVGGIETLKTAHILAIFSSSLFQLSLLLVGLRFFTQLSPSSILIALTGYSLYYLVQQQFAVPMSETMMVPVVFIATLHFLSLWSGQLKLSLIHI